MLGSRRIFFVHEEVVWLKESSIDVCLSCVGGVDCSSGVVGLERGGAEIREQFVRCCREDLPRAAADPMTSCFAAV